MLMTPGLALFYGGMVQGKNVLSTFMHSFLALGLVSLQWALIGYTLAFGPSQHGLIGGAFADGSAGEPEALCMYDTTLPCCVTRRTIRPA